MGQLGPFKKRKRRLNRRSIDFILAFCEKYRGEIKASDRGKKDILDVSGGYITFTMLMGIYNILINEGYTKRHLDNYFFFEGELNKHKEWTEQACKFYLRGDPNYNKYTKEKKVEDFFYETTRGIKLREEIDKL